MKHRVPALFLAVVATGLWMGAAPAEILPWTAVIDHAAADPAQADAREVLLAEANKAAAAPIIRRARTLAEVGQNRTWLDTRAPALEDEIRENFALAMSDFAATRMLAEELPLLAAAYRLSGDTALRERVLAQLTEMATWSPLQRPGWSLFARGNRLPPDGKDGSWLATGCGIRAIATCLEILPPGTVEKALEDEFRTLLEKEVSGIMDDWAAKRQWFVNTNNPITNQWVLPTEGLVRACLVLGRESHREAYEFGVKNLLLALDAHGADGEFEEGIGYASFTVTSLLQAARAMAVAGDRRAIEHPFLQRFPTWVAEHLQPSDMTINCFDAGPAYGAAERIRPLMTLFAACMECPVATWALSERSHGPAPGLTGLAAQSTLSTTTPSVPPLFAAYTRATRVNWRSSWDDTASGVWVRGGHERDQHDHEDRGHVNFILHGQPVFIEAGTPDYGNPYMLTKYKPGPGHNVLQCGTAFSDEPVASGSDFSMPGWQKRGGVAPITVRRLSARGGNVTVSPGSCYDGGVQWTRRVRWTERKLVVSDAVALPERTDVVLFRWHLGTNETVAITESGKRFEAAWPGVRVRFEASVPLVVEQVKMPDNTLPGHSGFAKPDNDHTCLVVRSASEVTSFELETAASKSR